MYEQYELIKMYKTIENVAEVLKKSQGRTILILKHSTICPISFRAKSEADKFLENCDFSLEAYLVVVQKELPVSRELEQVLEIPHQTPQALVVRDSKVEKVLNHFEISGDNLAKAVAEK